MTMEKRFLIKGGLIALVSMGLLASCKVKPPVEPTKQAIALPAVPATPPPSPMTLLSLARPAYHAMVHLDGEVVYLLTDDAIFLLVPGQAPRGRKLNLGIVAAATSSTFVYWSKGALWSVPKSGGTPMKLGAVMRQPHFLFAAEDTFAWIDRDDSGTYGVSTLEAGKPKLLHSSPNVVTAATMAKNRIVFSERENDETFRLTSVALDGSTRMTSPPRKGRPPSMLAAFSNDVAYYDGNVFEVRWLAADLSNERVVGTDIICSPLAIADRVYCGQVQGLFALSPVDHAITLLQPSNQSIVTAIAADTRQVAYILDVAGKLEVRLLTFR